MLDGMRRHKGWLKWSLALVCLTFVFLYVPGFVDQGALTGLPNTVLAQVGEHEITSMQFRRVYLQQLQSYRLQSGGEISEEMLRSLGVDRQILNQMINDATELSEAERLGLRVTDAEIRQRIFGDASVSAGRRVRRRGAVSATASDAEPPDVDVRVRGNHPAYDLDRATPGRRDPVDQRVRRRARGRASAENRNGSASKLSLFAITTCATKSRSPTRTFSSSTRRSHSSTRSLRSGSFAFC